MSFKSSWRLESVVEVPSRLKIWRNLSNEEAMNPSKLTKPENPLSNSLLYNTESLDNKTAQHEKPVLNDTVGNLQWFSRELHFSFSKH